MRSHPAIGILDMAPRYSAIGLIGKPVPGRPVQTVPHCPPISGSWQATSVLTQSILKVMVWFRQISMQYR